MTNAGHFVSTDGLEYKGSFSMGRREGEGALLYPNGDMYVGSFKNGCRHGYGVYVFDVARRVYLLLTSLGSDFARMSSLLTLKNYLPTKSLAMTESGRTTFAKVKAKKYGRMVRLLRANGVEIRY